MTFARRTLKQMTDAECIEAYRLNQKGEGPAFISGYGDKCSYRTADAMISRGERLLKAAMAAEEAEADRFCDDGQGPREDYSIGSGECEAGID